ncbi:MAG: hypothetical protein ACMUJM_19640 [bacterium]
MKKSIFISVSLAILLFSLYVSVTYSQEIYYWNYPFGVYSMPYPYYYPLVSLRNAQLLSTFSTPGISSSSLLLSSLTSYSSYPFLSSYISPYTTTSLFYPTATSSYYPTYYGGGINLNSLLLLGLL